VLAAAAALAAPGFASAARAATPQYTLTIAGTPGTNLFGISKNGVVFGEAVEQGAKAKEGFLLAAGAKKMVFPGSPGDQANASSQPAPEAINGSAGIAGPAASLATGNQRPVEWPGSATPAGPGAQPGLQNLVSSPAWTSINANGLITGFGSSHGDAGFTISGSTVTRLPALPSGGVDVEPIAVSDPGLIAGQAGTTTTGFQAAGWRNGTAQAPGMLPGSLTSGAPAVNSTGEAAGAGLLTTGRDAHAVLLR
jgi:hypothetical protein